MNAQPDLDHLRKLQAEIQKLFSSPCHKIGDFIGRPEYDRHTFQGIYGVRDPDAEWGNYVLVRPQHIHHL